MPFLHKLLQKTHEAENTSQLNQHYPDFLKADKNITRKLQSNILYEQRCKKTLQNLDKSNQIQRYIKNNTPRASGAAYVKNIKLV